MNLQAEVFPSFHPPAGLQTFCEWTISDDSPLAAWGERLADDFFTQEGRPVMRSPLFFNKVFVVYVANSLSWQFVCAMKSVLIINGSAIIATLFTEIFSREGWKVAACEDGDCAMDRLISTERYDVVILGYNVAGTNGVQLVRFIRALDHRKTTAVVMVTGSAEVTDEAMAAGADEVLPKPINPYALVCAVDKHVL